MHIHEGVLHPAVLATGWVITAGGVSLGLKRLPTERIMHAALLAAGFFVASFIHFSIGAVNVHLTLNALVGLFLGWGAFPVIFTGLLLQALLFNYGGLTVLGVNTAVMALPAVLFGVLLHRWLVAKNKPAVSAPGAPGTAAPPATPVKAREALIKWQFGNAQLFRLARRKLFFEAGVDSSVLDCFKKSEATPPNGINQRFPSVTVPPIPVVAAVVATLLCSNLLYVLALAASGKEFYAIARIAFIASLPLMAVEAPITLLVLRSMAKAKPAALGLGNHTPWT